MGYPERAGVWAQRCYLRRGARVRLHEEFEAAVALLCNDAYGANATTAAWWERCQDREPARAARLQTAFQTSARAPWRLYVDRFLDRQERQYRAQKGVALNELAAQAQYEVALIPAWIVPEVEVHLSVIRARYGVRRVRSGEVWVLPELLMLAAQDPWRGLEATVLAAEHTSISDEVLEIALGMWDPESADVRERGALLEVDHVKSRELTGVISDAENVLAIV